MSPGKERNRISNRIENQTRDNSYFFFFFFFLLIKKEKKIKIKKVVLNFKDENKIRNKDK